MEMIYDKGNEERENINPFPKDDSYQSDKKIMIDDVMSESIKKEGLYFKDLAEHLMMNGYACRNAYKITAKICSYLESKNKSIRELSDNELKRFSPKLNCDVIIKIFNPINSVNGKRSYGSTNPKLVRQAIAREQRWLKSGGIERMLR